MRESVNLTEFLESVKGNHAIYLVVTLTKDSEYNFRISKRKAWAFLVGKPFSFFFGSTGDAYIDKCGDKFCTGFSGL